MPSAGTISFKLTGQTAQFDQSMKSVRSSIAKTTESLRNVSLKAGIAFGALTLASKKLINTARTQVEAETRLAAAIRASGRAIDTKEILDYAAALQQVSTVGDEVTIAAAATLTTFSLTEKQIKSLLPGILDFSSATGRSVETVTTLIGRLVASGEADLSRYGIALSDTEKKLLKTGDTASRTALAVELLSKRFGGAAKALADTPFGKLEQATNAFGDALEEIGKGTVAALAPLFDIIKSISEAFVALPKFTKTAIGGFVGVSTAAAGIVTVVATVVTGLMKIRTAIIATSAAALKLITPLLLIPTLLGQAAQLGELFADPRGFAKRLRERQGLGEDAGVGEIFGASLKDAFQRGVKPLKDAMAFVSDELIGDAEVKFDGLGKTTQKTTENIEKMGEAAKKTTEGVDFQGTGASPIDFQSIGDIVNEGIDELNAIDFSGVAGGLIENADVFGDAVEKSAMSIQDVVSNVQSVIGQSAPKLSALAGDIAQGASKGGVWGALIGAFLNLLKQTEGFSKIMQQGEEGIGMLVEMLDTGLGPFFDIIININSMLNSLIGALGGLVEIGAELLWPIQKIADVFGEFAESMKGMKQAVVGFWNALLDAIADLMEKIPGFGKSMANFVRRAQVDLAASIPTTEDVARGLLRWTLAMAGTVEKVEEETKELEESVQELGVARGFKRAAAAFAAATAGEAALGRIPEDTTPTEEEARNPIQEARDALANEVVGTSDTVEELNAALQNISIFSNETGAAIAAYNEEIRLAAENQAKANLSLATQLAAREDLTMPSTLDAPQSDALAALLALAQSRQSGNTYNIDTLNVEASNTQELAEDTAFRAEQEVPQNSTGKGFSNPNF